MASIILDAMKNYRKNKHNVGSLNNWGKAMINQGAIVEGAPIDNYELVTLGFNAKGERTCTALADNATRGHLIASVEDYMKEYETISAFYNGVGERARIVVLEPTRRFECSNFEGAEKDLVANPIKNGQAVHYDATAKKYIISNGSGNHSDYAAAANKFVVVDADCVSLDGQQVVRFEIV